MQNCFRLLSTKGYICNSTVSHEGLDYIYSRLECLYYSALYSLSKLALCLLVAGGANTETSLGKWYTKHKCSSRYSSHHAGLLGIARYNTKRYRSHHVPIRVFEVDTRLHITVDYALINDANSVPRYVIQGTTRRSVGPEAYRFMVLPVWAVRYHSTLKNENSAIRVGRFRTRSYAFIMMCFSNW